MGSLKTKIKFGAMAKVEAVYGTPEVLAAATDGLDIVAGCGIVPDHTHKGERHGKSPATRGGRLMVGRMGRFGTGGPIQIEPAGGGAAYSASVVPNFHTLLRAGGMLATLDATVGDEKYTYTPAAAGSEESITLESYERGQKYPLAGVYLDWKLSSDVPGLPIFEFTPFGFLSANPSDAAVPAIVYTAFKEPPKCEKIGLAVTIDAVTFTPSKLKSWALECKHNIAPRAQDNTTGLHGGFNMGVERELTFEAVFEAAALTTADPYLAATGFNPFELMERAKVMALAWAWGTVQFNRFSAAAATAQLIESPEQDEGPASMVAAKWKLQPSSLVANDEVELTAD